MFVLLALVAACIVAPIGYGAVRLERAEARAVAAEERAAEAEEWAAVVAFEAQVLVEKAVSGGR